MITTTKRSRGGSTGRSSTSLNVPKTIVEQATLTLQQLPEKPKEDWSLKEAIALLQEEILAALARGYSHEEVASLLTEKGVEINASSLKYYLTRLSREKNASAAQPREKKPRKTKDQAIALEQPDARLNGFAASTASQEEPSEDASDTGTSPEAAEPPATSAQKRSARKSAATTPEEEPQAESEPSTRTKATGRTASTRTKATSRTTPTRTKATGRTTSARSRKKTET